MKKSLLLLAAALVVSVAGYSQKVLIVNTETIFKAIPAYNTAIKELDTMAEQYRKKIDNAYTNIEYMYDKYQVQKPYLSESQRMSREEEIITQEKAVTKSQQDIFGPQGEMMKKRIEKIKPIQEKVQGVITKYAEANGYDLVLDSANNQFMLYFKPANDKSSEIINMVLAQ